MSKPRVYYNEIDPFAAEWLCQLITAGAIPAGDVDDRSIVDIAADDLKGYDQCHFFAGIGVWSYSLQTVGWPNHQQVWTGSCPCQPFSSAGKQKGFNDERHLWPIWFDLIRECRPPVVFGEQVASALSWFDLVQGDLESEDYACGAAIIGAHSVGAPHIRQRLYFVGHSDSTRSSRRAVLPKRRNQQPARSTSVESGLAKSASRGRQKSNLSVRQSRQIKTETIQRGANFWSAADWISCADKKYRPVEPGTFPLAHGAPARVGRLRGYGNAICGPTAQAFIGAYMEARGIE